MSKTNRFSSPIAVAMKSRYGRTTSLMKDRRAPRGGSYNDQRILLDEYEENELYTSSSLGEKNNEDKNECKNYY